MLAVIRSSWALLLGISLMMIGNGMQGTLLGVRGAIEGFSTLSMSIVMTGYFAGFLLGSRIVPDLLRKVGHVRVFAALGSLVSAGLILFPLLTSPWAWTCLRLLVGFCFCGVYIVAESWLNNSTTNETRGRALSLYIIAQMVGIIAAQAIFAFGDAGGYTLFVLISVLVSVSFAPILLSTSPTPHHQTARSMPLRELIANSPFAAVGMLLLGFTISLLFAMSAVYGVSHGLSVAQTSAFVTAIFLGGLMFQYPLGWFSDRVDRRVLVIGCALVGAVVATLALFVDDDVNLLIGCAFLIGGMANPLYGLLLAYANDYLEHDQMASASSGLLFINGAGSVTGPVVVGWAMTRYGDGAFFVALILLMASIAGWGLWRMTQRSHDRAQQSPWVPVSPRTSAYATGLAAELADEAELEALEEDSEDYEPRITDDAFIPPEADR